MKYKFYKEVAIEVEFYFQVMAAAGGYSQLFKKRPPNEVLIEAQKYIRDRLEKKWLPLFLATSEFADRQRPKAGMDDVVDDVLVIKKKRSHNIQRVRFSLILLHDFSLYFFKERIAFMK